MKDTQDLKEITFYITKSQCTISRSQCINFFSLLFLNSSYLLYFACRGRVAFAFLFSTKVHGPEVGQRWEYLPVSNSRDEIGVINVTARSNFAEGKKGETR